LSLQLNYKSYKLYHTATACSTDCDVVGAAGKLTIHWTAAASPVHYCLPVISAR